MKSLKAIFRRQKEQGGSSQGEDLSRASSISNLNAAEAASGKGGGGGGRGALAKVRKSVSKDKLNENVSNEKRSSNDKKGCNKNNNQVDLGDHEELDALQQKLEAMSNEKANLMLQLGDQKGQLSNLQKEIARLKMEQLNDENMALRNKLRDVVHSPLSDNEKQILLDSQRHHSSAPASIAANLMNDSGGGDVTTCSTPDWDKQSSSNVSEVSVACLQDKINQMQETHYSTNEELQATLQELTDLQKQLTELQQDNEHLLEEKNLMFESLCRQTERLSDARNEIESLKKLLYRDKDETGHDESSAEREQKLVDLLKNAQTEREMLLVKQEQLNNEILEVRAAFNQRENDNLTLAERVRTLECTLDAKHAEHKQLDQDLARAKDKSSSRQIELDRLSDLLENARTKIVELEQDRALSDKSELDEMLDNARKEKDALESEVANLKEQLARGRNEGEKLREQVSILQEECKVLRNNAKCTQSELEYKVEMLTVEKNALLEQLQALEEAANELQVQAQCQLEDKRQLSSVLSETQRNMSEVERRNKELETELKDIKKLRAEENEEWDKFQNDLLTSVRVANDFKNEAQQELQNLVLENKAHRDKIRLLESQIEKLKENVGMAVRDVRKLEMRIQESFDVGKCRDVEVECERKELREQEKENVAEENGDGVDSGSRNGKGEDYPQVIKQIGSGDQNGGGFQNGYSENAAKIVDNDGVELKITNDSKENVEKKSEDNLSGENKLASSNLQKEAIDHSGNTTKSTRIEIRSWDERIGDDSYIPTTETNVHIMASDKNAEFPLENEKTKIDSAHFDFKHEKDKRVNLGKPIYKSDVKKGESDYEILKVSKYEEVSPNRMGVLENSSLLENVPKSNSQSENVKNTIETNVISKNASILKNQSESGDQEDSARVPSLNFSESEITRIDSSKSNSLRTPKNPETPKSPLKNLSKREEYYLKFIDEEYSKIDPSISVENLQPDQQLIVKLKRGYDRHFAQPRAQPLQTKKELAISKPLMASVYDNPKLKEIVESDDVLNVENVEADESDVAKKRSKRNVGEDPEFLKINDGNTTSPRRISLEKLVVEGGNPGKLDKNKSKSMSALFTEDTINRDVLKRAFVSQLQVNRDSNMSDYQDSIIYDYSEEDDDYEEEYLEIPEAGLKPASKPSSTPKYSELMKLYEKIDKSKPEDELTKEELYVIKMKTSLDGLGRKNTLRKIKMKKKNKLSISSPVLDSVMTNEKLACIIENPGIGIAHSEISKSFRYSDPEISANFGNFSTANLAGSTKSEGRSSWKDRLRRRKNEKQKIHTNKKFSESDDVIYRYSINSGAIKIEATSEEDARSSSAGSYGFASRGSTFYTFGMNDSGRSAKSEGANLTRQHEPPQTRIKSASLSDIQFNFSGESQGFREAKPHKDRDKRNEDENYKSRQQKRHSYPYEERFDLEEQGDKRNEDENYKSRQQKRHSYPYEERFDLEEQGEIGNVCLQPHCLKNSNNEMILHRHYHSNPNLPRDNQNNTSWELNDFHRILHGNEKKLDIPNNNPTKETIEVKTREIISEATTVDSATIKKRGLYNKKTLSVADLELSGKREEDQKRASFNKKSLSVLDFGQLKMNEDYKKNSEEYQRYCQYVQRNIEANRSYKKPPQIERQTNIKEPRYENLEISSKNQNLMERGFVDSAGIYEDVEVVLRNKTKKESVRENAYENVVFKRGSVRDYIRNFEAAEKQGDVNNSENNKYSQAMNEKIDNFESDLESRNNQELTKENQKSIPRVVVTPQESENALSVVEFSFDAHQEGLNSRVDFSFDKSQEGLIDQEADAQEQPYSFIYIKNGEDDDEENENRKEDFASVALKYKSVMRSLKEKFGHLENPESDDNEVGGEVTDTSKEDVCSENRMDEVGYKNNSNYKETSEKSKEGMVIEKERVLDENDAKSKIVSELDSDVKNKFPVPKPRKLGEINAGRKLSVQNLNCYNVNEETSKEIYESFVELRKQGSSENPPSNNSNDFKNVEWNVPQPAPRFSQIYQNNQNEGNLHKLKRGSWDNAYVNEAVFSELRKKYASKSIDKEDSFNQNKTSGEVKKKQVEVTKPARASLSSAYYEAKKKTLNEKSSDPYTSDDVLKSFQIKEDKSFLKKDTSSSVRDKIQKFLESPSIASKAHEEFPVERPKSNLLRKHFYVNTLNQNRRRDYARRSISEEMRIKMGSSVILEEHPQLEEEEELMGNEENFMIPPKVTKEESLYATLKIPPKIVKAESSSTLKIPPEITKEESSTSTLTSPLKLVKEESSSSIINIPSEITIEEYSSSTLKIPPEITKEESSTSSLVSPLKLVKEESSSSTLMSPPEIIKEKSSSSTFITVQSTKIFNMSRSSDNSDVPTDVEGIKIEKKNEESFITETKVFSKGSVTFGCNEDYSTIKARNNFSTEEASHTNFPENFEDCVSIKNEKTKFNEGIDLIKNNESTLNSDYFTSNYLAKNISNAGDVSPVVVIESPTELKERSSIFEVKNVEGDDVRIVEIETPEDESKSNDDYTVTFKDSDSDSDDNKSIDGSYKIEESRNHEAEKYVVNDFLQSKGGEECNKSGLQEEIISAGETKLQRGEESGFQEGESTMEEEVGKTSELQEGESKLQENQGVTIEEVDAEAEANLVLRELTKNFLLIEQIMSESYTSPSKVKKGKRKTEKPKIISSAFKKAQHKGDNPEIVITPDANDGEIRRTEVDLSEMDKKLTSDEVKYDVKEGKKDNAKITSVIVENDFKIGEVTPDVIKNDVKRGRREGNSKTTLDDAEMVKNEDDSKITSSAVEMDVKTEKKGDSSKITPGVVETDVKMGKKEDSKKDFSEHVADFMKKEKFTKQGMFSATKIKENKSSENFTGFAKVKGFYDGNSNNFDNVLAENPPALKNSNRNSISSKFKKLIGKYESNEFNETPRASIEKIEARSHVVLEKTLEKTIPKKISVEKIETQSHGVLEKTFEKANPKKTSVFVMNLKTEDGKNVNLVRDEQSKSTELQHIEGKKQPEEQKRKTWESSKRNHSPNQIKKSEIVVNLGNSGRKSVIETSGVKIESIANFKNIFERKINEDKASDVKSGKFGDKLHNIEGQSFDIKDQVIHSIDKESDFEGKPRSVEEKSVMRLSTDKKSNFEGKLNRNEKSQSMGIDKEHNFTGNEKNQSIKRLLIDKERNFKGKLSGNEGGKCIRRLSTDKEHYFEEKSSGNEGGTSIRRLSTDKEHYFEEKSSGNEGVTSIRRLSTDKEHYFEEKSSGNQESKSIRNLSNDIKHNFIETEEIPSFRRLSSDFREKQQKIANQSSRRSSIATFEASVKTSEEIPIRRLSGKLKDPFLENTETESEGMAALRQSREANKAKELSRVSVRSVLSKFDGNFSKIESKEKSGDVRRISRSVLDRWKKVGVEEEGVKKVEAKKSLGDYKFTNEVGESSEKKKSNEVKGFDFSNEEFDRLLNT